MLFLTPAYPTAVLQDKICLGNILFVSKCLNNLSLSVFNACFVFLSEQNNYETPSSGQGNLIKLDK